MTHYVNYFSSSDGLLKQKGKIIGDAKKTRMTIRSNSVRVYTSGSDKYTKLPLNRTIYGTFETGKQKLSLDGVYSIETLCLSPRGKMLLLRIGDIRIDHIKGNEVRFLALKHKITRNISFEGIKKRYPERWTKLIGDAL